MISPFDILRLIPAYALLILIIHIPLLFLLRKYTKIDNFLKFVHVFFTTIIIVIIGILLLESSTYKIFLDFIIWYWFIPSLGASIVVGVLYKLFNKSFRQNFYSSFLLMTIFHFYFSFLLKIIYRFI